MPVRRDDSGRRWVEMDILVPGSPEQVWAAVATGPGTSAWFTPTTIEEEVGGAVSFDFGGGQTQPATVTRWEPPHRFAYEEENWSATTTTTGPLATEITVTARSGDRCVIRMVHSLFTDSDDWDDELESFEQGWPGFFEVLRRYLRDFAGARAALVHAAATFNGDVGTAWRRLAADLGLAGCDVGDRCATAGDVPALTGVVDLVHQDATVRDVLVRLDEPSSGIAVVGAVPTDAGGRAMVTLYLYGDRAAEVAAAEQPRWSEWASRLSAGQPVAT